MSFTFKNALPLLAVSLVSAMLLPSPLMAADTASPSAVLDRLESQVDGLKARLHMAQGYGYSYGRPPSAVGGGGDYDAQDSGPGADAAGLEVRVGRIEEQLRQINGRIEQTEFAQHKLEDQLKKFQQDVDFRFQDAGRGGGAARPQKRTELEGEGATGAATGQSAMAESPSAPLRGSSRRGGDAFDPGADPNAPGAPRQLGSIASSATALPPPQTPRSTSSGTPSIIADEGTDPDAPLDLSSGRRSVASTQTATPSATTPPGFGTSAAPRQIPLTPQATPDASASPSTQVAAVPPIVTPKEEFDSALGSFKAKEYETAEKGFSTFLQKNPKNRMASDAIYYLGESYFQRGRQREAAEQYLKITQDYPSSTRAPEAMLRLGQSLNGLGAKEQACASFGEITRKYPNASAWVKSGAEREAKKAQC